MLLKDSCLMSQGTWFTVQQATFVHLTLQVLELWLTMVGQLLTRQYVLIVDCHFNSRRFDLQLKD